MAYSAFFGSGRRDCLVAEPTDMMAQQEATVPLRDIQYSAKAIARSYTNNEKMLAFVSQMQANLSLHCMICHKLLWKKKFFLVYFLSS